MLLNAMPGIHQGKVSETFSKVGLVHYGAQLVCPCLLSFTAWSLLWTSFLWIVTRVANALSRGDMIYTEEPESVDNGLSPAPSMNSSSSDEAGEVGIMSCIT